jgi:hypothetical protein
MSVSVPSIFSETGINAKSRYGEIQSAVSEIVCDCTDKSNDCSNSVSSVRDPAVGLIQICTFARFTQTFSRGYLTAEVRQLPEMSRCINNIRALISPMHSAAHQYALESCRSVSLTHDKQSHCRAFLCRQREMHKTVKNGSTRTRTILLLERFLVMD